MSMLARICIYMCRRARTYLAWKCAALRAAVWYPSADVSARRLIVFCKKGNSSIEKSRPDKQMYRQDKRMTNKQTNKQRRTYSKQNKRSEFVRTQKQLICRWTDRPPPYIHPARDSHAEHAVGRLH
eukprot:GHVU01064602.1.p1 GENE.GHVU01064602.1~~GHVU01064602.1.p1  ORF type:complete len:126 (+),score=2.50 GHVU01064602.1:1-378(+)